MSEWISVEDRLPENTWPNINYLVFRPDAPVGNEVCTVRYDSQYSKWCGNFDVTHWQPLPSPPRGEG